jgi:type I restriction enzyme, S subunit
MAIATRLTQLRRKHELLQTYKRGVMQKLFSQEIRFRRDDGKPFPDWDEKILDELGEFKNGFNADKSAFGDGVEFINLMDIFGNNEIKKTSLDRVQISQQQLNQYKVQKGDTLFVRSSVKREGVGQSCLVNDDFEDTVYSGFIIRFRDKVNELIHLYKKYCFSSLEFRQNLLSLATSSANTNINQESLSAIKLTYPCKEEQEKIVSFLTLIDQKIEAIAQQIDLTAQFKKGLLQKMFV